ncbi:MAG: ARPP-1 family domain-containing protein [Solirubrobacteraceae bacterium]
MPTLAPRIAVQITLAEPSIVGSLAVFPLIADRSPSVRYVAFAEAVQQGATGKEMGGGGSVNDLIVHNPLDVQVLLYEGEEVLGAQQNRTFDVSALVAARSVLQVPVSCVEAGRWDGARHDESFVPAPQTANPRLRRMKNTHARASLAAGMEVRAVQGEVWREVADTAGRHGVNSRTGAMHDVFERRREQLDTVARAVEMHCSQVGMLAAIAGRFVVLDYVSEVEALPLCTVRSFRVTRSTRSRPRLRRRRRSMTRGTSSTCFLALPARQDQPLAWGRGCAVRIRRACRYWLDLRGRARNPDRVCGRARAAGPGDRRPRSSSVPSPAAVTRNG